MSYWGLEPRRSLSYSYAQETMFRVACTVLGLVALSSAVLPACSLDNRELRPVPAAFGSDASAVAGRDAGGDAGSAEPAPLPICHYGGGVLADCATLVENPGFSRDTSPWRAEQGSVTLSWETADADANPGSGSLSVVNALSGQADGIAARGAAQCLPTVPGQAYGIAADVFIPNGQGDGFDGGPYLASAGLSIIFFQSENCDGLTVSNFTSELLDQPKRWTHLEGRGVSPQGAGSMSVRLITLKNFRQYTFEANFDNVLVKAN